MTVLRTRLAGAAIGVVVGLAAGGLVGGWWWMAAAAVAAASIGGVLDRQLAFVQVLGSLALVAGAVAAGHDWFVVVLAAGTVASIELAATADRATVVRPRGVGFDRVAVAVVIAAVVATGVLVVGAASTGGPTGGVLVAAAAALLATRVIAR